MFFATPQHLKLSALSLALAFALGSAQTLAQTAAPPAADPPKEASEASKLETVKVTAQRREQELQAVPLPVSTFSARDLENRGVTATRAIADYTPNMIGASNTGLGTANMYFLRGLGNTESISTFDPPVGTYVNDVYVARQGANNFSFFDVERVEVLRGPQGTLFGRNTTGGAINVILKKPGDRLQGYVEAGTGSYSAFASRGSVDVPMGENLKTKFSYFYNDDDGYVKNTTTGEQMNATHNLGARAAMRWKLGKGLIWDLAADRVKDEGLNVVHAMIDGERRTTTGYRAGSSAFFNASGAPLTTGEKNNYGQGNDTNADSITSNLLWSMDNLSIEFITGWRDLKQKFGIDFLPNPAPTGGFSILNDSRSKQFTQEVKATGELMDGKLNYVAGLFYMREQNTTDFADILRAGPNTLVLADRYMSNDTRSMAVYGQVDYKFTPQITATLGLRYTDDDKDIHFRDNRPLAATPNPATRLTDENIAAAGNPLTQATRLATPRAALAYEANKDLMFFTSATRGFKSGGWSSRATSAASMQEFFPEKVWSYEAGWRSTWMGNRLRFNATAFHMDVTDLQTVSGVTLPTGQVVFLQKNFAGFRNDGLEIEIAALPLQALSAYLNIGLQDAKYTDLAPAVVAQQAACRASIVANATSRPNCNQGIVTASGDIGLPVRAPKVTLNPGLTYTFPVMGGWQLAATGSATYTSRMAAATNNIVFAGGHTVFNAALALSSPDKLWRVSLECSNCGDKYWVTANLAGLNYLSEPRRWALRLTRNFK